MGHIRLGTIPKSLPWRTVVASVLGGSSAVDASAATGQTGVALAPAIEESRLGFIVPEKIGGPAEINVADIAAKTLDAAHASIAQLVNDEGLRHSFFLLTQLALATREGDWRERLNAHGIHVLPTSSLLDLTVAFQAAVDSRLAEGGRSTDIGEIAQRAAGEVICRLASDRSESLFGNTGRELQLAISPLATREGFGRLGQAFFGSVLTHYLNFYLSRVTASELGRGSIQDLGDISRFNAALARHCEQSAAVVRDFASEWYSKTEWAHGIDQTRAGGFVAVAVQKLRAELGMQKEVR